MPACKNKIMVRKLQYLRHRALWLSCLFLCMCAAQSASAQDDDLWSTIARGECVVLMRHAIAPGTGDPEEFELTDCSTQRNLSDEGREQARRIGGRFRVHGIDQALVYSSQWCRCLETAELLGLGRVRQLPLLNSFFQEMELEEVQTLLLEVFIARHELKGPVIMVTHQVNITALTGVFPQPGELVVVGRPFENEFPVLGRIATD